MDIQSNAEKLVRVIMKVDPKTFDITVVCKADAPYIVSEKTVAIKKFAEAIALETEQWKATNLNPKVDRLLAMVDEFNKEMNPEYFAWLAAINAPPEPEPEQVEEAEEPAKSIFSRIKGFFTD
jgi:hypothetical protein